MKTNILAIIGLLLCLTSCGDMYEHYYLDGMWQMRSIEYKDGIKEQPEDVYYSFQKHTIYIRKVGVAEYWGSFIYENDSLFLDLKNIPEEHLRIFGINTADQRFYVKELNSNKMILKSNYSSLEFRKY